jgi:hypothetical protein
MGAFATIGARLIERGYAPVPIIPGSKRVSSNTTSWSGATEGGGGWASFGRRLGAAQG